MADETQGATKQEQLIDACRHDNVGLAEQVISEVTSAGGTEEDVAKLLNETKTVMGNHLYHEAASRGNSEIIDFLLDQPGFECDPISRQDGDTPLHSAIRWINAEGERNWEFGNHLVGMMLEAGSSTRVRNKARLVPLQLVDPRNTALRELIQRHEYAELNQSDFVDASEVEAQGGKGKGGGAGLFDAAGDEDDDDAEFSGSDEEERAEWERRRKAKGKR